MDGASTYITYDMVVMLSLVSRLKSKYWRYEASRLYKKRSLKAIPSQLGVCMIDKCNLECAYCMRESFSVPEGKFTVELIKGLLKRMPYIKGVCIMGLCEPFLNPNTPDIIRWLKKERYGISLTTNGMIPLTSDRLDALRCVDDFVFSIDTSNPETFKLLRGGANLGKVMGNLVSLLKFKRSLGLGKMDNPPIHINAVITSHNFEEIPDLIRMLEPYADELTYLMVDPVSRPDYQCFERPLMLQKEFEKDLTAYRQIAKESKLQVLGFDWMFEESHEWCNCLLSWDAMFLQPNGDAYFCYNYDTVLGNVFQDDPLQVWNSSSAKMFRRNLGLDNPPLEQCRSCNFARVGWQPEGAYSNRMEDVK